MFFQAMLVSSANVFGSYTQIGKYNPKSTFFQGCVIRLLYAGIDPG